MKDLLQVKSRFGKFIVASSFLGTSRTKPAPNCTFMKKLFDVKVNG